MTEATLEAHKVLIVDDEEKVLKIFKEILPSAGYKVEIAGNAEQALELVDEKGPFSVVISDNRMKGERGIDLLTQIKTASPKTMRILITAHFEVELINEVVNKCEAFRFLKKPLDFKLVIKAVQEATRKYEDDLRIEETIKSTEKLNQENKELKEKAEEKEVKMKKLKSMMMIGGIILLVLMLGGGLTYFLSGQAKEKEKEASSKVVDDWTLYKNKTALGPEGKLLWMTVDYRKLEGRAPRDWGDAISWKDKINKKKFAGYSDWRVPTIEEYRKTYDPNRTRLAFDQKEGYRVGYPKVFQEGGGYGYWSDEQVGESAAKYFFFIGGYDKTVATDYDSPTMSIRLVRSVM